MIEFTDEKLTSIIKKLKEEIALVSSHEIVKFKVLNPDISITAFNGEVFKIDNKDYIYRGYNTWLDLAQRLFCKMLSPKVIDDKFVLISFLKLNVNDSFHKSNKSAEEKYGNKSLFSKINKTEENSFIYFYTQSLENVKINKRLRILNLGINSGDEFLVIKDMVNNFLDFELVGIDISKSAIQKAKENLPYENCKFYAHDINDLDSLELGTFDLIVTIGTLQSGNIEFKPFFMSLVQNYLKKDGAMILGFPNCRWIDTEMIYGAKAANYSFSEMSILFNDVIFCKKYLQQKKFRVTITGKDYIFLTASSIRKKDV